jgi:hypothetical protein
MIDHFVFLVEEPSAEAALLQLLPKLLGNASFSVHPYQSKQALLDRLPNLLRGYACWLTDSSRLVVLVDRDNDDCHRLKTKMEQWAKKAGLGTKRSPTYRGYKAVTRLAIEELEAWFFGDWQAVRAAYPRVPASVPRKAPYRDPDAIKGGTWEALERVLRDAGYFATGLRKIEAARAISHHMDPVRNTSHSFQVFCTALR